MTMTAGRKAQPDTKGIETDETHEDPQRVVATGRKAQPNIRE